MTTFSLFAHALRYPYPGQVDQLEKDSQNISNETGIKSFDKFIAMIKLLSLTEQEELYTRTLDLSPLTAPYVGYQIWGESYQRGEFMANLNQEMKTYEIDLEGELPDHLGPVLLYLDAASAPLPELLAVLEKSVLSMHKALKKNEADNPYLRLFTAIAQVCKSLPVKA
jgi:nitrate reductase molybdenum cofactor assembly chaperone NarJ/NarW